MRAYTQVHVIMPEPEKKLSGLQMLDIVHSNLVNTEVFEVDLDRFFLEAQALLFRNAKDLCFGCLSCSFLCLAFPYHEYRAHDSGSNLLALPVLMECMDMLSVPVVLMSR